jgi:hypothetical protein
LPALYLGTTLLSLLAVGKSGAADNYFIENYAALCLCGGVVYERVRTHAGSQSVTPALVPGALAAFVMLNLHCPTPPAPYAGCRKAYAYVRASKGTKVLSDNVGAVLLGGKPVLLNDPFNWSDQVVKGRLRAMDNDLIELIRTRHIDVILLGSELNPHEENWPSPVLDAIARNYSVAARNYSVAASFSCPGARFAL